VPPQFSDTIWELVTAQDDLLNLVGPEPTSSNVVMKLADETTPWGSTGVQAAWRTEAQQMTASKLATSKKFVTLEELYAFVLATDELLQDAPRLNDRLTRQSARAISWKASDAIMWGTGAGQPLGFMSAPALVTVSKESGQAAATLAVNNLAKIFSRILVQPGSTPLWIGNRDILPQLIPLTIGNQPVWVSPSAGLHDAPGGFLLGLPLRWSEHASTLGTLGDLVLIDPQGYYAVQRDSQPQFASSIHLYFDYGVQAFRWTFRFGGEPFLSAAVSPAHGSNTKSSFVTLQAR
jgi:HK97 family phage major capsid protein